VTSQTRRAQTAGFLHHGQSRRRAAAVNMPASQTCRPGLTAASTGTPSTAEEPRPNHKINKPVYTDTLTSSKPVGSPADDPPVRGSGHDRGVDPDGLDLELVENRSSSVTADQNEPVVRAPLQLVGNVGGELGGDIGGVGGVGTLWRAGEDLYVVIFASGKVIAEPR
jgi:hypothetical protein